MDNRKKRNTLILVGLLVGCFLIVGVSYAVWQLTLTQTDSNVVTTGCFKVEFTDQNPINLDKAYPITDEEGKGFTPYEFTITNTCEDNATYQINLEVLNDSTLTDLNYLKNSLNISTDDVVPTLLTSNESASKTLSDARSAYKLEVGYLKVNETKTYHLRLWMDYNTPTDEAYMNKTFNSKITVTTSYLNGLPKTSSEQNVEYIKSKATSEMIIEDDGTIDHNLRYIGANPNNYIDIGDRDSEGNVIPWRIIGFMNNVDDGSGNKETRLKVIRNEGIGVYSWDTSASGVNRGLGINEWSQADLMKLLNAGYEKESVGGSLYWNNQSGTCYNGTNNATTACDFTSSGLSLEAHNVFGTTLWHTGSNGTEASFNNIITSKFYEFEQSSNTGKICTSGDYCNDTVERTTTWVGTLGLMSPSDYGYATSGGATTNRETCLNRVLYNWDNSGVSDCKTNDWLYNSSTWQWTLVPFAHSSSAYYVFSVYSAGHVYASSRTCNAGLVRPTGYLLPNVKITDGDGTIDHMFQIQI